MFVSVKIVREGRLVECCGAGRAGFAPVAAQPVSRTALCALSAIPSKKASGYGVALLLARGEGCCLACARLTTSAMVAGRTPLPSEAVSAVMPKGSVVGEHDLLQRFTTSSNN